MSIIKTLSSWNYLITVSSNAYHILPGRKCRQETNMSAIKRGYRLNTRMVPQKDGSRFKLITAPAVLSTMDIIDILQRYYLTKTNLIPETHVNQKELHSLIRNYHNEFVYFIYHTHTFIDSMRVIPVLVHYKAETFYNASCLWPELNPEDNFGILITGTDDFENLRIPKVMTPEIIEYRASKHLCPTCGRIYDTEKPKPISLDWKH